MGDEEEGDDGGDDVDDQAEDLQPKLITSVVEVMTPQAQPPGREGDVDDAQAGADEEDPDDGEATPELALVAARPQAVAAPCGGPGRADAGRDVELGGGGGGHIRGGYDTRNWRVIISSSSFCRVAGL